MHSYIDHKTGKPRLASPHGWYAIQLLKEAATNPVIVTVISTHLFYCMALVFSRVLSVLAHMYLLGNILSFHQ